MHENINRSQEGSVQPARLHTAVKVRPPLIPRPPNELASPGISQTSPDGAYRRVITTLGRLSLSQQREGLAHPRLYHLTRLANVPCQSAIAVHGRVVDGGKQHMAIVQTFKFNSWNASSRSAVNAKGLLFFLWRGGRGRGVCRVSLAQYQSHMVAMAQRYYGATSLIQ